MQPSKTSLLWRTRWAVSDWLTAVFFPAPPPAPSPLSTGKHCSLDGHPIYVGNAIKECEHGTWCGHDFDAHRMSHLPGGRHGYWSPDPPVNLGR